MMNYRLAYNKPILELLKPYNIKIKKLLADRKEILKTKDIDLINKNGIELFNVRNNKKKISINLI